MCLLSNHLITYDGKLAVDHETDEYENTPYKRSNNGRQGRTSRNRVKFPGELFSGEVASQYVTTPDKLRQPHEYECPADDLVFFHF